jgi:hypothetical protein
VSVIEQIVNEMRSLSQVRFVWSAKIAYIPAMGERRKRKIEWEVIRMRARGEHLGVVSAPDEQAALKIALKAFALEKIEEKRLLIRRR